VNYLPPIRLRVLPALLPVDAREVEFRVTATDIEWRYVPDFNQPAPAWQYLIARAALIGPSGPPVELRTDGTDLQYRVVGTSTWFKIITISDLFASANAAVLAAQQAAAIAAQSAQDAINAAAGAALVTGALPRVTRATIRALDTGSITVAYSTDDAALGLFQWTLGDFTEEIAADTAGLIYLRANAVAASAGAWVRIWDRDPNRKPSLAKVLARVNGGANITIACYGDSLTYGQDETPTGTLPPINSASQQRSSDPYPETLQASLSLVGFSGGVTVFNRGFPGDSSRTAVARWALASETDVAFIMYGHNDANNYGGFGLVSVEDYRVNVSLMVERRLSQGTAVIILLPPRVNNAVSDAALRPYVAALRQIAADYELPCIDTSEQLSGVTSLWTDTVHLTSFAYAEIGWHLAALFLGRDAGVQSVAAGHLSYPTEHIGRGGTLTFYAEAKGNGQMTALAPGETLAIGAYCSADVLPIIHSLNGTAANIGPISAYYAGGTGVTKGLRVASFTHILGVMRQKLTGPLLHKGYRTLYVRNDGAVTAYIEAVEFAHPEASSAISQSGYKVAPALVGIWQPAKSGDVLTNWWASVDYSTKVKAATSFIARLTLTANGTSGNGIAIFRDPQSAAEIMSNSFLWVYRNGTSLIVRELVDLGLPVADTTTADVFAAGPWTGEIQVDLSASDCKVYVDGVLRATRVNPAITSGFPGLLADKAERMICHGTMISGAVKGPY